jgi:membrane fusion protein (multidrug efflux system)
MADHTDTQAPPAQVEVPAAPPGPRLPAGRSVLERSLGIARRPFLRTAAGKLTILLIAVALVGGFFAWRYFAAWESTDDAQIDAYIYPVSARISGYITKVNADDNQQVKAGDTLVEIDSRDYEVALDSAQAAYANDRATADASRVNVPVTSVSTSSQLSTAQADLENARAGVAAAESELAAARASLRQAEANNSKAQDDVARYAPLAEKNEIPRRQYDQAVDTARAAAAAVDAAKANAVASEHAVAQARAKIAQAEAAVSFAGTRPEQIAITRSRAEAAEAAAQKSKAALDQAKLNLEYTRIIAPIAGVVGQRSAQVGKNVAAGQQLMSIVPLEEIWVTANFKETQLKKMHPGQPAKVSVDAYGREYDGHVLSIAGASGSRFSLFPPENATGNYVKVVQRIPVKIVLERGQDPQHLLRPGMSVEARVKIE